MKGNLVSSLPETEVITYNTSTFPYFLTSPQIFVDHVRGTKFAISVKCAKSHLSNI